VALTQLLSIAPRLNVLDPCRRPRTVPLPPSPHRRTRQRQRLNLFQCPRRQYRPRKAARRAIDVGVVVVADPPPRLRMQCRWMGRRSLPGRATGALGADAHGPVALGATQTRGKPHVERMGPSHVPQPHRLPSPGRIRHHSNGNSHC